MPQEGCEEVVALLERSIAKALEEGSLMCYKPLLPDVLPASLEAERQQKLASLHSQIAALKQARKTFRTTDRQINVPAAAILSY